MTTQNKAAGLRTRAASNSTRSISKDALLSRLHQMQRERQESQRRDTILDAISDNADTKGCPRMLTGDAEIQELAKLSPMEYDRIRNFKARELKCRPSRC